MDKLLLNMSKYLKNTYDIDLYSATNEQKLEAGRAVHGRGKYLPSTNRGKSNVRSRWHNSLWKKAQFLSECKIEEIYTLLIELKTEKLYSKETADLAADIARKLPGKWFYWVEEGKKNGIHMHVILCDKTTPNRRMSHDGRYFYLRPRQLQFNKYDDSTEAIVRTIAYGAKIKYGGYRGDGLSWESTWLAEVNEKLDCERVCVRLSNSNMPTRGIKYRSLKIDEAWKKVDRDRQRKYANTLSSASVYDLTA